jgi:type 1 glutamine amidotransferase
MPLKPSSADINRIRQYQPKHTNLPCAQAVGEIDPRPRSNGCSYNVLTSRYRQSGCRIMLGHLIAALFLAGSQWIGRAASPTGETQLPPSELLNIEQALPAKAPAAPRKPRKLLIFDLNVNYGGHGSIPYANTAFRLMGQKTGAYETVVSHDPACFAPDNLRQFDAVFFNNNVGNLFEDPELRRSLIDFVYGGGGLLGVHGTTVAFTRWPGAIEDWPEFGFMLGARGANHRESQEHVFIKLDDPGNPLTRQFNPSGFDYRDEFFRPHDPYSRNRVRVLLSIDTTKTDLNQGRAFGQLERADHDFALAWIRNYGRGRVFYCTIAHNPYVFYDPNMLGFYLRAIQFALGDLDAPTTPSSRLTPAVRAQESLGWRVALLPSATTTDTVYSLIDQAAKLDLDYAGVRYHQQINGESAACFDPSLTSEERSRLRLRLDAAGVRLLNLEVDVLPTSSSDQRKLFEFARIMGIETIILPIPGQGLDSAASLAREFDLNLALADRPVAPHHSPPSRRLAKIVQTQPHQINACADLDHWQNLGIKPSRALGQLKERVRIVRFDTSMATVSAHSAKHQVQTTLKSLKDIKTGPLLIGLQNPGPDPANATASREKLEAINRILIDLATSRKSANPQAQQP